MYDSLTELSLLDIHPKTYAEPHLKSNVQRIRCSADHTERWHTIPISDRLVAYEQAQLLYFKGKNEQFEA